MEPKNFSSSTATSATARPETSNAHWCDLLVIGSGAAGLSSAVTAAHRGLQVVVAEKEPLYGGTTARSGGWLWVPGNPLAKEAGLPDTRADALAYMRHEAGEFFHEELAAAFLDNGPKAIEFFRKNTAVQFEMPVRIPDYHAEAPGGSLGARSIVAAPFDGRLLGDQVEYLAPPLHELTVFGVMVASGADYTHFLHATQSLRSAWYVTRRLSIHFLQKLRYGRGMKLVNGNALVGRLAKSAFDLGVDLWLQSPAQRLIVEDGRVVGAIIRRAGSDVRVMARHGVVLACGGYPHDIERRGLTFPGSGAGERHYSPAPAGNTGDGIRMGEGVGGYTPKLAEPAAWLPVSITTRKDGSKGVNPHIFDKSKPGVIAVSLTGLRFANEGNSYHDFVRAMRAQSAPEAEVAAWLICDHKALRKYGLGYVKPFPFPIGRHLASGYLIRANSVSELAKKLSVKTGILVSTVERYNQLATTGVDDDYGKGDLIYNRYLGDPWNKPNPNMSPLETGPYYAVKLLVGDLGTFAGLATDGSLRVVDQSGHRISGLYAVGNDISSVMGGSYPGAGITLGPALTFGYLVGITVADEAERLHTTETGT
ncbi:FAD-dependent oxidoreductase [Ottowia thiooxydans]|uniref:FAD-dependent oxidoreductase n=1 Tax=Ottowia thiooxydans TaxID=219182 RepID=UPI0003F707E7|nr:FAD-dependent oxidoreductase [Ottowia thiooxydans]